MAHFFYQKISRCCCVFDCSVAAVCAAGSHLRGYDTPQTFLIGKPGESTRSGNPAHEKICDQIRADTTPVECFGTAGTVTFWHHKLTHNSRCDPSVF